MFCNIYAYFKSRFRANISISSILLGFNYRETFITALRDDYFAWSVWMVQPQAMLFDAATGAT